jgi:hypothetical protein
MARELAGRYRLTAKNNIKLRRFCDLAAGGEIELMTGKVTRFQDRLTRSGPIGGLTLDGKDS